MTVTLILNTVWLATGVIFGYIIGWVVNHRDGSRGENIRALIGLVILVLVGFSAFLNYRNAQDAADNATNLRNEVECQRNFNEAYRTALQAQLDASAQEIRANKELLLSFSKYTVAPPDVRDAAFAQYFGKVDAAERLRSAHPLAVVNTCGPVS